MGLFEEQDLVTARNLEVKQRREKVILELNIDPETVERFDMYIHEVESIETTRHLAIQPCGMSVIWIELGKNFDIVDKGEGFYTFRDLKKMCSISIRPTGFFTVNT